MASVVINTRFNNRKAEADLKEFTMPRAPPIAYIFRI